MSASSQADNPGRQSTLLPTTKTTRNGAQYQAIDQVVAEGDGVSDEVVNKKDEPVTWRSLPHRRQLIILTLSRLSEPLVQTSLQV
jgi:hypothetical protein